jgi:hypothetical protein
LLASLSTQSLNQFSDMIPKAEALTAAIADMQRDLTQHSSHLRRSQPPLHPQKLRPESRAATRANALLGN